MRPRRANFYAFALNEFRYRRVSFTMHRTQVAAEASAYRQSGQSRFRNVRSGDRSAESDLYAQVVAGLEGLEAFAREGNYDIDWDNHVLVHKGDKP